MENEAAPTVYDYIGAAGIRRLVDAFYELVFEDPVLSPLFKGPKEEIKEKQYLFLTQFFGGPPLYSQVHGHPRMRMRHLPHRITPGARDAWLDCMQQALQALDTSPEIKDFMLSGLTRTADHMVNTEE